MGADQKSLCNKLGEAACQEVFCLHCWRRCRKDGVQADLDGREGSTKGRLYSHHALGCYSIL
eukprot:2577089-Lingulodinium_polyedra.AAC.1